MVALSSLKVHPLLSAVSYLLLVYLFSSVPFGLALSIVVADTDPREGGSGNI
ncbi:MAG: glycerol-3-phosphate acyltransferase PlsY, partial [Myxococcota bacterium]